MKKKIISLLLSMLLLMTLFNACQSGGSAASGNLLEKLPSSVKNIAFIDIKKATSIEVTKELTKEIGEDIMGMLEKFDSITIGIPEVKDFNNYKGENLVIYVSGKYTKDDIKNIITEQMNNVEIKEEKIQNIDAFTFSDNNMTVLFISDSFIAITMKNYANEVIEAAINKKNTVDKNSDIYKLASKMNSNIAWVVADLANVNEVKDVDITEFAKSFGIDIEGTLSFEVLTLGLSENNEVLSLIASTNVDKADMTTKIADGINAIIPSMGMLVSSFLQDFPADVKTDIQKILKETKMKADGNNLSTKIDVKISTIEQLSEMAPALMQGFGGY